MKTWAQWRLIYVVKYKICVIMNFKHNQNNLEMMDPKIDSNRDCGEVTSSNKSSDTPYEHFDQWIFCRSPATGSCWRMASQPTSVCGLGLCWCLPLHIIHPFIDSSLYRCVILTNKLINLLSRYVNSNDQYWQMQS